MGLQENIMSKFKDYLIEKKEKRAAEEIDEYDYYFDSIED